jgi:hypothetical protein
MRKFSGIKSHMKWTSLIVFAAALVGCGGSSYSSSSGNAGSGGSGNLAVALGSGTGSSFQSGVLNITVTSLSAGGSTSVTANLQNSDGTPYTQSATIDFTSTCAANGLATLNPASVTTTSGTASTTYTAAGCSGTDKITATATINSSNLSAAGTLTVQPQQIKSLQFKGPPTQTIIALQGTGGISSSNVTFQVNDVNGNPVPGVTVNFVLSTTVGGITLAPSTAKTLNNGDVTTTVQAGTQHASVSVIATVQGPNGPIQSSSSAIIISTGIPTQNNVSVSVASHNVEAWSIDGVQDTVTVHLTDRFQNPVPDGTAVSFTTNGGGIYPGCFTANATGSCTVNWFSTNPRPVTDTLDVVGHAHVLAYTVGEESFTDVNGNGVFDDVGGVPEPFTDIGEIFMNSKETGSYIPGEFFYDYNKDGVRNAADGAWEGLLCEATQAICGPNKLTGSSSNPVSTTTGVGQEQCIVMSTSGAAIIGPNPSSVGHSGSVTFVVSDTNGNVLASGSTVKVLAVQGTTGVTYTISPFSDALAQLYTVGDVDCAGSTAYWPLTFTVTISPISGATSYSGAVYIQVTSPGGTTTSSTLIPIS